jgi:hypothetical protein
MDGMLLAPLSDHFNANHLESIAIGECAAVIAASHCALGIIVDDLAKYAGGTLTGGQAKVNGTLSVALADRYATFT